MERKLIAKVLVALTMMQSVSYAEVISDLPVPGESNEQTTTETTAVTAQAGPRTPPPPTTETASVSRQYTGQVQVKELSRKKDGEIRKITLSEPLSLQSFEIKVLKSRVKIHEVTLLLAGGQRSDVREMRNSNVGDTGGTFASGNLNLSQRVAAIEIRAESYGAESDLLLTAISYSGAPRMTAQEPVVKPSAPAPLPTPSHVEESSVIRVGDVVHFEGSTDYVGQVLEVFQSGMARVRFKGYSEPSVIETKRLGRAVNCKDGLCVGDRVLFQGSSSSYVGTISASFANGKHQVRFPGYSNPSYISSADLKKSITCTGEICAGGRVVYKGSSGSFAGTVQEAFLGGHATVRFDGYSNFEAVSTANLSKSISCSGGICVDDRVLFSGSNGHFVGRVAEVFADGTAKVRFDGYVNFDYVNVERLAKQVTSAKGFTVESRVLFVNDVAYTGIVREVFSNGMVGVRFRGYSKTDYLESKRLGLSMTCSGHICVGNRVVLKSQHTGTVTEVYSNGFAAVKFDRQSYSEYADIRLLMK